MLQVALVTLILALAAGVSYLYKQPAPPPPKKMTEEKA